LAGAAGCASAGKVIAAAMTAAQPKSIGFEIRMKNVSTC
jgi:hypothetical protein